MVTSTADRVRVHTDPAINLQIDRTIEQRIEYFNRNLDRIDERLRELEREWDVERVLETGSSTLTLLGVVLGLGVNRKWFLLSLGVQIFFMQHALQGWCPPLPILRHLGVRTADEINRERYALKNIQAG